MSSPEASVLSETDPFLRQSIEAMGMPDHPKRSLTEKIARRMIAGGLVVASVFGVYESQNSDVAEAAFDNRIAPGQEVCAQVGRPGDVFVSNGTITNASGPGYATQGPKGANPNAYSTHNFDDGAARPNLNMTKIKSDGNICVTPSQSSAHVLIDGIGFLPGELFESYGGSEYPTRIMDTRQPNGPTGGALVAPGQEVCAQVGRPGDVFVSNGTITNASGPGYATQGPKGANPNAYSTHNFDDGAARPNLNMTKIKSDGNICVTPSQSSAHVLIDGIGFLPGELFESYGGSEYPTRIMDTRQPNGPTGGALVAPGQEVCAQVGRPGDVFVSNGTITNASGPGYATQGPKGANPNAYSTHNFDDGAARPNLNMTKIKSDGNICVTPSQSSAHVLIDGIGFLPGELFESYGGSEYPTRIMDTRTRTEPGVPIVAGAIGGILLNGVCNNADGNDYINIINSSNEPAAIVIKPSADAQFESLSYSVVIPPGGTNSGFTIRSTGKFPSVTAQNRAGQYSLDFTPCGDRPPIVSPIVSGVIAGIYVSRSCVGPNEGYTGFYTNDNSSITYTMRMDIGDNGSIDLSPTLGVGQQRLITQSFYSDYHSATIDGKAGKIVVDYSPCKILPPGHRGNVTQFPL